ncbi:uncharacterized protein LOC114255885 [Camellia sinensis]|uniref:uncharacterized protein LOC114255885 n=1 Tax=Camellia sinensis TaxID=4442 RepID=UPI0010357473|nr:uncharacterized protein LOC114255885 [Camellia sinensis]
MGNGERIHFWTDRWFNDMSLRCEFPRLFSLSVEKDGSLQFFYQRKGLGSDWKLAFRRSLLAWEEEEVQRLNVVLAEVPNLNLVTEDNCLWKANNSGVFTVASVWERLEVVNGSRIPISNFLWKNAAPPKAQFFSWLAWKGRIKTVEFMHRIGALPINVSSLCVFCKAEVETINHVLLLCPLVWKLWSELISWWEVQWVTPRSVVVLLDWWSDFAQMVERLKVRIALWVKSNVKGVHHTVHDIVTNLKQVSDMGCWSGLICLLIWTILWRVALMLCSWDGLRPLHGPAVRLVSSSNLSGGCCCKDHALLSEV